MIVTLRTERIRTLDQMRAFVEGNEPADFEFTDRTSAYAVIRRTLVRFEYHTLRKPDKGLVRRFLEKATGFSEAQMDRLIAQHRRTGGIRDHRRKPPAKPFPRRYTAYDAALLAEVDAAFGQLSGPATKVILWRMRHVYGDERFERRSPGFPTATSTTSARAAPTGPGRLTFRETRSTPASFGVRRKPRPHGQPGFLRVDTVHLGDLDGKKGAYVINVVDEVTQFQHLGAVRRITQQFMIPILEDLISAFPFTVQAFHADNGSSEYVNREVADLLNRLHIPTFTKSRPRRSNDNALVESKNGSIVRRWLGHVHVSHDLRPPARRLPPRQPLPPPQLPPALPLPQLRSPAPAAASGRPTGRMMSPPPTSTSDPCPAPNDFLRPEVTFEALDQRASTTSDLDAAKAVQRARDALFRAIGHARDSAA